MIIKIALALIILWLIGPIMQQNVDAVVYTLPVIAIVMILFSDHRRMLNNPNDY